MNDIFGPLYACFAMAVHFFSLYGRQRPLPLLVHTTGQKTTIHREHVSSNKTCRIGSQEYACASKFFNLAEPSHRRAQKKFLCPWSPIQQCRVQFRTKYT